MAKIMCTKGTGMQFEEALRSALGVDACGDSDVTAEPIMESRNTGEDARYYAQKLGKTIGSKMDVIPSYAVNLPDGSSIILFDSNNGDVEAIRGGDQYGDSALHIVSEILAEYGKTLDDWNDIDNHLYASKAITAGMDIEEDAEITDEYMAQLADEVMMAFDTEYPIPGNLDVTATLGGISITLDTDEDVIEAFITPEELSGDLLEDKQQIAEEFYCSYDQDIESATNTSSMQAVTAGRPSDLRKMPSWMRKWYKLISDEEMAAYCSDTLDSVKSWYVDNLETYDAHHIGWAVLKDSGYDSEFDTFSTVELVEEDGDVFPGEISGNRLSDATDEIKQIIATLTGEDADDNYESDMDPNETGYDYMKRTNPDLYEYMMSRNKA